MLYIDMDGVLADFDGGLFDLYGATFEGRPEIQDEFWNRDCHATRFFSRLKPIPGGIDLLDAILVREIPVCILTSTGGGRYHIEIAQQKLDWLAAHGYRALPIAFAMNTVGKAQFAPGNILIDDRAKVIIAWEKNGGRGIHFAGDAESVLEAL